VTQVIYRGKFACLYIKLMISAYRRYETNLLTVFVMFSSLLGIVVAAVDAMTFVPGSVGACLVRSDSGRWQGLHARLTVVTASGRRRRFRLHPRQPQRARVPSQTPASGGWRQPSRRLAAPPEPTEVAPCRHLVRDGLGLLHPPFHRAGRVRSAKATNPRGRTRQSTNPRGQARPSPWPRG